MGEKDKDVTVGAEEAPLAEKAERVAEAEATGLIVDDKRRVAVNASAPTIEGRTGVVDSEDGPIAVLYGVGQYATTPLNQVPDWYLAHVMGDAADVKWHQLTKEQQAAFKEERDRRNNRVPAGIAPPPLPVSDLTSLQELDAKAKTLMALEADGVARGEAAAAAATDVSPDGSPESTSTPASSTFKTEKVTEANVADAEARITKVKTVEDLDAIEAAEKAGKNRVGIQIAIDNRRAALAAGNQD
jgi:hypothetical protein